MKLSEAVESKLGEVVELWAEEHLPGRPAILGCAVYASLADELLKKQKEIEDKFPLGKE
jgi:hypothetical protein